MSIPLQTNLIGSQNQGSPTDPTHSEQHNTIHHLVNAFWNVKDYGALGDNSNNDTTAVQAAIDAAEAAGGGVVFFPQGIYKISSLSAITDNVELVGSGRKATILRQTSTTATLIDLTADGAGVRDLSIDASGITKSAGAFIKLSSATRDNFVKDVTLDGCFQGIWISSNAVITHIERVEIINIVPSTGVGILIEGGNDTYMSHIVMDNPSGSQPLAGINVKASQAIWLTDSDCIHCGTGLLINPGAGQNITWFFILNSAFDTCSALGAQLNAVTSTSSIRGVQFTSCWFATNGTHGFEALGHASGTIDGVQLHGCRVFNNDNHGILINKGINTTIDDCQVSGNSQAASGTDSGIAIATSVTSFNIRNCRSGQMAGFGNTQAYGILLNGSTNNYIIAGNDLRGNVTAGLSDYTQGTVKVIDNNLPESPIHEEGGLYNVRHFGAVGDDNTDDTTAIQAVIDAAEAAGGGVVYFPPGIYKYTTLNVTVTGVTLEGAGASTILRSTDTDSDWITFTNECQYAGISKLILESDQPYGGSAPTAGYAVKFDDDTYRCALDAVVIRYAYNAIFNKGTENRFKKIEFRHLFGVHGYFGNGPSTGSYRCIIDDLNADNPYPGNAPTAATEKTWTISTAFSLHDVVRTNNAIYQCTTAGTSSGAGTGPNAPTSFTAAITDGTAQWKFVSRDLLWVVLDSYAYSTVIDHAALLNGYVGIVMQDTSNTGTSYPVWIFGSNIEIDHSFSDCVILNAGEGVFFDSNCWFSSTLQNNGINANSGFRGELRVTNSRIFGCARHGILIDCEEDIIIESNFIGGNSQEAANTYHGIVVGSNINGFIIRGNKIGDLTAVASQQHSGIFLNSGDGDYTITDNDLRGNDTAGISGGNFSTTQIIRNNRGFVTESNGSGTLTTTSIAVTHNLSMTPNAGHITITWAENPTTHPIDWWISGITSTQFTLNVEVDPGASDLDFFWSAHIV